MTDLRPVRSAAIALASLVVLGAGAASCRAQSPPLEAGESVARPEPADAAAPSVAEIAERRARALARLDKNGLLLLRSGEESESSVSGFRPDPDFYYLTGLAEPDAILVLDPAAAVGGSAEILFLEPANPRRELWDGPRLTPGPEAVRRSGIAKVLPVSDLDGLWDGLLRGKKTIVTNAPRSPRGEPPTGDLRRIAEILAPEPVAAADGAGRGPSSDAASESRPAADDAALPYAIRRPSHALAALRQVKSPAEIECVRRAIDATCDALRAAMSAARPGLPEYRLQALIEFTFRDRGCERPAFASIVGSGPNSCVLHYRSNRRTMEAGDLVVMDVGGEYRGYAADVTRTIPVSGRFTPEQRAIYDIVLRAQAAGIAKVAPGASMRDVHRAAHAVIEEAGYGKLFLHGTSHWVGLDVHDVGTESTLRPGMILTVEPGIYLAEKSIGVRIEDTVLVTETGCEVLSDGVTKDPAEIEAIMGARSAAR